MPELTRDGEVAILDLGDDENRFGPAWLEAINGLLDEVDASEAPRALVTTASGKQYSSGLDLAYVTEDPDRSEERLTEVVRGAHLLYARMLEAPYATVAAIPGHAFAAGAMLTLAHDARIMRVDRGFWCLPEVDLGMGFTSGMAALIQARLTPQVAHEVMVTGCRLGGQEAADRVIVDAAVEADDVLSLSIEQARQLAGKPGAAVSLIRKELYGSVLTALRSDDPLPTPT